MSPFDFEAPEDSPGFLLWQTTVSWQRLIKKALEHYDISHAQFVIMASLLWFNGKEKEVTQIDIINMTKLDKMTVSKSLKKLATLKLIKRHENTLDTRAKTVFLTKTGKTLIKKLAPIVEQIDADFFSVLKHEEQHNLIKLFQKINT